MLMISAGTPDPLAVSLAKTTWVVSLSVEIKAATKPIVIPVYIADSLFAGLLSKEKLLAGDIMPDLSSAAEEDVGITLGREEL
ncbi:hypothetical protein [Mesorhizobium sp.]|uniref:hypothetical protein n=1 Tax=Mesorhizobium sp. TaxID=1871066 RepID=UPI00257D23F4|nr:hypothetical protein [Mesorhizobium sp.]